MQTGRQQIQKALAHVEDAIPIDFGATAVTGMHASVVAELREHYGLEKRLVRIVDPYQMLGLIEEDLIGAMGVATAGVFGRTTMFGFPLEDFREWRTPWGQEVLIPSGFRTTTGPGGETLIHPQGDLSRAPSGKIPSGGYFADAVIRQEPIVEEKLDPEDNLEEFTAVTAEDVAYFRQAVTNASSTSRAVVAAFGGTALGDIALVPGTGMKNPRGIRDVTEWYISTLTRQDYVHTVFDRQSAIAVENLSRIHAALGDSVDVVYMCGTDFGTQSSQFCSTETFESLYAPYYRRMNDWIHRNTAWKTFKHSCGAVAGLIPHLADAGFDIINPVRLSAAGMDAAVLKRSVGSRVVFWGGGVDTQKTLPFGTPEEVRQEVLTRCEILGRGGGFVFNSIHNVQARTPIANVVAMIDAVHEYNGRRR